MQSLQRTELSAQPAQASEHFRSHLCCHFENRKQQLASSKFAFGRNPVRPYTLSDLCETTLIGSASFRRAWPGLRTLPATCRSTIARRLQTAPAFAFSTNGGGSRHRRTRRRGIGVLGFSTNLSLAIMYRWCIPCSPRDGPSCPSLRSDCRCLEHGAQVIRDSGSLGSEQRSVRNHQTSTEFTIAVSR